MSPRNLSYLRILAVAGCALLAVTQASAQAPSASPFMPFAAPTSSAPTSNAPLEYRGFMETAEGIKFRLHDPAKKSGIWLKLNEKAPDFDGVVKQHNVDADTLVVEHQGRTLTLALRLAKVVSGGPATVAMPAVPVALNVPPAVTQTVAVNPTPAQETARLQSVADEVARRRALREQASQQQQQPGQPQPQVQVVPSVPPAVQPPAPVNAPQRPQTRRP